MADPVSPFTPEMQAQISQLIGQQADRSARTAPIHQAAMAMAQHMAPGYAQSAMTPSGSSPMGGGGNGLTPSVNSGGGPGMGTTAAAAFFAALLKDGGNNPLMLGLKKLISGGAVDPTFGGLIQGNKPLPGGTGFPDVPVGGSASPGGMSATFPGYFTNPNGSTVQIPGDPTNSGMYGGGLFGGGDTSEPGTRWGSPDRSHD